MAADLTNTANIPGTPRKRGRQPGTTLGRPRGRRGVATGTGSGFGGAHQPLNDLETSIITYARQHNMSPKAVVNSLADTFGTWGV